MENNVVLYHANCLDGFGAAFAAWYKLRDSAKYIPVKYGKEPPWDEIIDKNVFILDFSYSKELLMLIKQRSSKLVVIDHHLSAQKELEGLPFCTFDMNRSGCVMAWEYFFKEPVPLLLLHIQDRDLWRFNLAGTKEINAALYDLVKWDFDEWYNIVRDKELTLLYELEKRGTDLLLIAEKDVNRILTNKHTLIINGIEGLACNSIPKYSSDLGNKLSEESGTFGATYFYTDNKWLFQLRSKGDFDVSVIAKSLGGGGHKNAAGFEIIDFNPRLRIGE